MVERYIRWIYNQFVRLHTPKKISAYNGIAVRNVHLFDTTDAFPNYEGPLISAIRAKVKPGDSVVVVGGGRGVSSVVAAHQTGRSGSVITYEGGTDRASLARETVALNKVSDIVEVNHAVVGEAIVLADAPGDADIVTPEDLPECDVLVLDCEGVEKEILQTNRINSRVVIVETHAFLNSPPSKIRKILENRDFTIENCAPADEELGVFVLTALNDSKVE